MRTLNIRLLAILLVGGILVSAAGYGVHGFQVRRNAGALLRQAETAKNAKRWNEAMDCLQRYVALVPRDNGEALADLGLLQADANRFGPALRNLQGALRQLPDRTDVRRKLVDVELVLRKFADARRHIESLLGQNPDDPELLLELLAKCHEEEGNYDLAVATLSKAIESDPQRLSAYALQARIHQERLNEGAVARSILDQMVSQNSSDARAYVIRGANRLARLTVRSDNSVPASEPDASVTPAPLVDAPEQAKQSRAAALEDARAALELAPDSEPVILFAIRCLLANQLTDEARKLAEHGKELFAENPDVHALLAEVELQANRREEAIKRLAEGVKVAKQPQRSELLWNLCNLYLDENELDKERAAAFEAGTKELRKAKFPSPRIDYLEARLPTVQRPRQWLEASVKLEKNRPALVPWPDLLKQADYLLGKCYQALGNPDLQLTAFRRAAGVDPLWVPARMGVADTLLSMGNVDGALREYQEIAKLTRNNPVVLLQQARAMIIATRRRSPRQRDWSDVMRELARLESAAPKAPQVAVLKAEVLLAQDQTAQAIDVLQAARDDSPEELYLWLMLTSIAEQRGDWVTSLRTLDEAQAKIGDSVPLRLARARLLANQPGSDPRDAMRKLAEPAPEHTVEQIVQLYTGMAGLMFALKDYDEAARFCQAVAKIGSSDMRTRLLLFDTAIRAPDWSYDRRQSVMDDVLKEMLELGGKGPLWHYGMAVRLRILADEAEKQAAAIADKVESKKKSDFCAKCYKDAKQHLALAGATRRNWPRVPLLLAEINKAQGDDQAALVNYREAIQRGERDPAILNHTVILLHQRGMLKEAEELIRSIEPEVPLSNAMIQISTEFSLQTHDQDRAMDLVSNRFRANDAAEHIWRGQKLATLGKPSDAEDSFRKAIELDKAEAEPWIALIQFLGRNRQFDKAAAAFEQAERSISRDEVSSALARCLEFTGKSFDEMEARYQSALAAAPNDATVIRRTIDFYLRQQRLAKAEPLLQQLIGGESSAKAEERAWARRNLALAITMTRADRSVIKRAIGLLDENLKSDVATNADRRAKAMVLSMLPEPESKREAIDLLEALLKDAGSQDTPETAEERFVLAQQYLKLGDVTRFTGHMQVLLASHGDEKRYVEAYAAYLIKRGDVDEAESWLKGLEKNEGRQQQDVFSKIVFSLETLYVRERYADILSAVDSFVGDPQLDAVERRARVRRSAAILEDFSARLQRGGQVGAKPSDATTTLATRFLAKAEEFFRRNAKDDSAEALALAGFCSRHGQSDEALDILERVGSTARPAEITVVTTTLMIAPKASPEQLGRVEKVLRSAIEKQNRHVLLVQALADLQSWREEYDEAELLYRESLSNGDHPLALNNLALLLALRGKGGKESSELIEKAVELVGLDPSLLDSRATINLALGNPQLAATDLILAIEKRPSPLNYFHQAQVALRLGQKESARNSMTKANELGLQLESLHPLERKTYRQLQQELR